MVRLCKLSLLFLVLLLAACNLTKKVPEGDYLLYKSHIKTDVNDIPKDELEEYLRQTPNSYVFGLVAMRLGFYNWAGPDSTKNINKMLMRVGEAPVIYNQNLTEISAQQLQRLYQHKGYIKATVTPKVQFKGKKATVEYNINSNKPYTIRRYKLAFKNKNLIDIASDTAKTLVQEGMLFDTDILNAERERITAAMRQQGFYNFSKEFLLFSADSSLNARKVDITFDLRENVRRNQENNPIFKQYHINKVIFYTNNDAALINDIQNAQLDTVQFRNFIQIGHKNKFIKLDALVQNTYINPNTLYSDVDVEKTYSALNSLGPVKYTNISFKETADNRLDCYIIIVPSKTISFSTEAEGTFTEGFWGGAVNVNVGDRNAFRGAESLTAQLRGAMEWQQGVWAKEIGGKLSLKFPKVLFPVGSFEFKRNLHANTDFNTNISFQSRPSEFTVTNFGGGINYSWMKNNFRHDFDLVDISYINFLEIMPEFTAAYITTGLYNKYNYENHLIMRMGYNGSYSNFNPNRPMRDYSTMRYSVESSGSLLYALNKLLKSSPGADGYYRIFNIRYSQYLRAEYNTTHYQIFDKNNRFVYHAGIGIGTPFGNGDVIPYERRFYSGGANSVRGWSESRLGPGVYTTPDSISIRTRDYNQVGDIKLDLNMEYRAKLFWVMEGALFLDAGNIWTIRNYENQTGGQFKLDSFMKQIAIAYGAGLRFDFSFFIFRFDAGVKLYDPSKSRLEQWRVKPKYDDWAFHVAIGYPF